MCVCSAGSTAVSDRAPPAQGVPGGFYQLVLEVVSVEVQVLLVDALRGPGPLVPQREAGGFGGEASMLKQRMQILNDSRNMFGRRVMLYNTTGGKLHLKAVWHGAHTPPPFIWRVECTLQRLSFSQRFVKTAAASEGTSRNIN